MNHSASCKSRHTNTTPARKPTSSSSEQPVSSVEGSEPWKSGTMGKYQYHPGGDTSKGVKDAPSALHSVILPNVNLPKVRFIWIGKRARMR